MLKKRMRKKDTKKDARPQRNPAQPGATRIPCLSLAGLGKGGLGWLGWANPTLATLLACALFIYNLMAAPRMSLRSAPHRFGTIEGGNLDR